MRYIVLFLFLLAQSITSVAQTTILSQGVILFEEKVNVHKQMARFGGEWFEQMKDKIPKYKTTNYDLVFTETESLYKRSKTQPPTDMNMPLWMRGEEEKKTDTYKNLEQGKIQTQKYILDQLFLIDDSLLQHKWKITDEFRIIAGYNCRRATTIIRDSVYVIAFYTDAIPASTGPLSFSGLPGAILGLVLPKLNTTYFAKEIKTAIPAEEKIIAPTKGEKTNYTKAVQTVEKNANQGWMKEYKHEYIWGIFL